MPNPSIVVNIIYLVDGSVLDLMSCGALSILACRGFANSMSFEFFAHPAPIIK